MTHFDHFAALDFCTAHPHFAGRNFLF